MGQLRRQARLAFILCLFALPAGVAAHLALTDIAHGGPDLSLEWTVLRLSAVIIAAALFAALRPLRTILEITRSAD